MIYPPRGFIAEDTIVLGSINGQPLLAINSFWENNFNDDRLMVDIIEKSAIGEFSSRIETLKFLNENIRKNLRFQVLNDVIFKVSFTQATYKNIRPFLNTFTSRMIKEMTALTNEELEQRIQNARFQYQQLRQKSHFVHELFALKTAFEKLIPGMDGPPPELDENAETGMVRKIGLVLINELNTRLFSASLYLKKHVDNEMKILSLFPRLSRSLTDQESMPKAVQPFLMAFYVFIPISMFLIFVAGLLYLAPAKPIESNPINGSN